MSSSVRRFALGARAAITAAVVLCLAACSAPPQGATPRPIGTPSAPGTITAAPATGSAPARPVGSVTRRGATYDVADPLPPEAPGALIAVRDEGPDAAVGGVDRQTILFHSTSVTGQDVAESGSVFFPAGTPPPGGWPVISWAHGTTGIADKCAPSETPNLFYDEYAQLARLWLQHGYAVVAADYRGLGTPGVHSYLIGGDEGNAVIDIVTAAHHLDDRFSPNWFAVGHSQGGQAVLYATRNAATRNPALPLLGAVAIAPASGLKLVLSAVISGIDTSDTSYAIYALIGLSTVDESVRLDRILGAATIKVLPVVLEDKCLDQTDAAFTSIPPDQLFTLTADQVRTLSAELDRFDDPETEATHGPVLVVQGATDRDVPPPVTAAAVHALKALGADINETVYPSLDHDQVIGPSSCDVLTWLQDHGGAPASPCTPQSSAP